ncbi:hypothetical protein ACWDA3_25955 [Nonomuraea rubra]
MNVTIDQIRLALPPGREVYSRLRGYGTIEGAGQMRAGLVVYVRWEQRKRAHDRDVVWREAVTPATALQWRAA